MFRVPGLRFCFLLKKTRNMKPGIINFFIVIYVYLRPLYDQEQLHEPQDLLR